MSVEVIVMCPGTEADVGMVTFQSGDSSVEFIVDDAVNDVSFSFLPIQHSRQASLHTSPAAAAAAAAAAQVVDVTCFMFLACPAGYVFC